ncbi:MAG: transglycosylase SLT domain-containing protein [Deltaproteobacteria bacterium]|nr:transglycosylase SLT domain-containing protein [Deltaproteobacteria bacterium]
MNPLELLNSPNLPLYAEAQVNIPEILNLEEEDFYFQDPWKESSLLSFLQDNGAHPNQCLYIQLQPELAPEEEAPRDTSSPSGDKIVGAASAFAVLAENQPPSLEDPRDFLTEGEAGNPPLEKSAPGQPLFDFEALMEESNPRAGIFEALDDAPAPLFSAEELGSIMLALTPSSPLNDHFPSLINEKVSEFIGFFQRRTDDFFLKSLARSQAYADMMKRIFREKNLPEELFYLALIESGFNPKAFSRAKASGIWQFVRRTARRFGLKVDKWIDERRDPEKSTYAAAEYLKSLYEIFQNWDLVAASYNAGEGKVLRAMKKAKSQDFWEISRHRYLKRETKNYVPMFLAAVAIAKEPEKYGFTNIAYHPPLVYEKVVVPPGTSLQRIAKAAAMELSELQALNPALKRGNTPPHYPQFEINLPPGKKEIFEKNFYPTSASNAQVHRVRSGETLAGIARKYRIDLRDLCRFNDLSPQVPIKPGQILLLPP